MAISEAYKQCDLCNYWLHMSCACLDLKSCHKLGNSNEHWYCLSCLSLVYRFILLDDHIIMDIFCFTTTVHEFDSSICRLNSKFTPDFAIFTHNNNDLTAKKGSYLCVYILILQALTIIFLFANSISFMHINFRSMAKNFAHLLICSQHLIVCLIFRLLVKLGWLKLPIWLKLVNLAKFLCVSRVGEKGSGSSLIDNIFCSDPNKISSDLICADSTDHFPIFACLQTSSNTKPADDCYSFLRPITIFNINAL